MSSASRIFVTVCLVTQWTQLPGWCQQEKVQMFLLFGNACIPNVWLQVLGFVDKFSCCWKETATFWKVNNIRQFFVKVTLQEFTELHACACMRRTPQFSAALSCPEHFHFVLHTTEQFENAQPYHHLNAPPPKKRIRKTHTHTHTHTHKFTCGRLLNQRRNWKLDAVVVMCCMRWC